MLVNEVGRDYLSSTLDALKSRSDSASPELKDILMSAHSQLTAYLKAIDDLPLLQELRPPLQLRRAIALRRSTEMRETMDSAHEQSILRKLTKQVQLKAGVGWFSVENGNVGETHQLKSLSHEITLPRRYMSDPISYAINGLLYRNAKRGSE